MKSTKRLLAMLVAMAMVFAVAACSSEDVPPVNDDVVAETPSDEGNDVIDEPVDEIILPDVEMVEFINFGVMAFNHREFTIPARTNIKVGGNMGPRPGGEGGGASDAIRIVGFQGYPEPEDGFNDGLDSTWQILISQNGPFWENIDRIEAGFYLEGVGGLDAEEISNVEVFMQGGGLWSYDWVNPGYNLLNQFSEENGGNGFHWGNEMTAVWSVPDFIQDRVEVGGRDRELFGSPPVPDNPEDEESDKNGGGISKFGLIIETDNPINDIDAKIIWTSVTIYVYDIDLFMEFVAEVEEITEIVMSEGAIDRVRLA
jgi:hypothetical protein